MAQPLSDKKATVAIETGLITKISNGGKPGAREKLEASQPRQVEGPDRVSVRGHWPGAPGAGRARQPPAAAPAPGAPGTARGAGRVLLLLPDPPVGRNPVGGGGTWDEVEGNRRCDRDQTKDPTSGGCKANPPPVRRRGKSRGAPTACRGGIVGDRPRASLSWRAAARAPRSSTHSVRETYARTNGVDGRSAGTKVGRGRSNGGGDPCAQRPTGSHETWHLKITKNTKVFSFLYTCKSICAIRMQFFLLKINLIYFF